MQADIATLAATSLARDEDVQQYVTVRLDKQLFGIPVLVVRDVLRYQPVTPIPLAPGDVSGLLNLRGRIVTAIDARHRLGLPPIEAGTRRMSVVVDHKGELFSIIVDSVGEVLALSAHAIEKNPANLEPKWKEVSSGISKLKEELLIVLDVKTLLNL